MQQVTFESHHYAEDGKGRRHRERQDISFQIHGDSLLVYLPPPYCGILFVDVTPESFVAKLDEAIKAGRRRRRK